MRQNLKIRLYFCLIMTRRIFLILVLFAILSSGCTKRIYDVVYPTLSDGKYDTEFPYKDCSAQLEDIARTIKRINHIAYYNNYAFAYETGLTLDNMTHTRLKKENFQKTTSHQTASGTATVIYADNKRLALLTCAHIIHAQDTIISYYPQLSHDGDKIIRNIAILKRQNNYVIDIVDGGEIEILAIDHRKDIAIIGKRKHNTERMIPTFQYPTGRAHKLEWGSFVYVMGFPMGNKMITRGIVSNPKHDPSGSFLVDALFNRGFSGGLVLAIKDGVPNFELVGMAKSVSAHTEYVLRPEKEPGQYSYDPSLPYKGDVFVQLKRDINYGITHALSMEAMKDFFKENDKTLRNAGFNFDEFLGR
ncbi:trypsin-like peptidase domain-containing protein [bacterium]|nr:trypsin-like peptidase domain-containing protein [bacterium]